MTVAELIEELRKLPQDLPVVTPARDWAGYEHVQGASVDNIQWQVDQKSPPIRVCVI